MKHYNIPFFIVHSGCPNRCVFCNQEKITGKDEDYNEKEVSKTILKYVDTIPENSDIEVAFFGGSFTAIDIKRQERLLKEVKPFIDSNRVNGIRISTRPDCINKSIVDFLKEYKVTTIEIGAQSFNTDVLKYSERGHTREDIVNASNIILNSGINLGLQLMPGLFGSSKNSDINDAYEVAKLKPSFARIYPTLVIAGSKLEELYFKNKYKALSLEEAVERVLFMTAIIEINKIKIIRVGLQPSEELREEGVIIAGPFHPAFKELVEGEIYYRFFIEKLKEFEHLDIRINKKNLSRAIGINKRNLERLKGKITIRESDEEISSLNINNNKFVREEILKNILNDCEML